MPLISREELSFTLASSQTQMLIADLYKCCDSVYGQYYVLPCLSDTGSNVNSMSNKNKTMYWTMSRLRVLTSVHRFA